MILTVGGASKPGLEKLFQFILNRPALALAIGVSAIMAIGLALVWIVKGDIATDFSVYWRTAHGPLEEAYSPGFEYPFPYMPTMLLWIMPLKALPLWPAFLLSLVGGAAMLAYACRPFLTRAETWLVLASPPVTNGLLTGQAAIPVAAIMLWACGTRNRVAAGVALGIAASIKPQLLIMAPVFLLLRRDWRAIGASALVFASIVGISVLTFGIHSWQVWYWSLPNFHEILLLSSLIGATATPAGIAESYDLAPLPFLIAGAVAGLWLVYRCRKVGALEAAAVIATGSILASPYALTYDLAPLAPFLAWAVFRGRIVAALGLSAFLHPLPLILTSYELVRRAPGRKSMELRWPLKAPASEGAG